MERIIQHVQQKAQVVTNIGSGVSIPTMALMIEVQNWFTLGAVIGGFFLVWAQIYFLFRKNKPKKRKYKKRKNK